MRVCAFIRLYARACSRVCPCVRVCTVDIYSGKRHLVVLHRVLCRCAVTGWQSDSERLVTANHLNSMIRELEHGISNHISIILFSRNRFAPLPQTMSAHPPMGTCIYRLDTGQASVETVSWRRNHSLGRPTHGNFCCSFSKSLGPSVTRCEARCTRPIVLAIWSITAQSATPLCSCSRNLPYPSRNSTATVEKVFKSNPNPFHAQRTQGPVLWSVVRQRTWRKWFES